MLLLRLLEGWAIAFGGLDTRGSIGTALTVALDVSELRSIEQNRAEWGA